MCWYQSIFIIIYWYMLSVISTLNVYNNQDIMWSGQFRIQAEFRNTEAVSQIFPSSKQTFTCPEPTIETLGEGVKFGKATSMTLFWCLVNFKHISHLFLVFLLLTSSIYLLAALGQRQKYIDQKKSCIISTDFMILDAFYTP